MAGSAVGLFGVALVSEVVLEFERRATYFCLLTTKLIPTSLGMLKMNVTLNEPNMIY